MRASGSVVEPGDARIEAPMPGDRVIAPMTHLHLLRFGAAAAVLGAHLIPHWQLSVARLDAGLLAFSRVAFFAVDVFFAISGYLMWRLAAPLSGWRGSSEFLRRRLARIYSGYLPFLLLAGWLLHSYFPAQLAGRNAVLSFTLLPPFWLESSAMLPSTLWLPVAWTLIYELHFYLGITALIAFRLWGRPVVLLAGALVVLLATTWALADASYAADRLLQMPVWRMLYLSPYFLEMLLGAGIAVYCERRRVAHPALLLAAAGLLVGLYSWINQHYFNSELVAGWATPQRVLLALPLIALLLLAAVGFDQRGPTARPRVAKALGESTYTLYLAHTLVLMWVVASGLHAWMARHDLLFSGYLLVSAVLLAGSVIYTQQVDAPLYRLFRRILGAGPTVR